MSKFNLIYLVFFISVLGFVLSSNSNGIADVQGVDRTGSPISLPPCSSCHTGGNFGTTFTIEVIDQSSNLPISEYTPGETYNIEFSVNTNTGSPQRFGFQGVALMGAGSDNAGTFSNPSINTEIHTIANGRTYVEQLIKDPSSIFTVDWQAPAAGSGSVTLYGVGNAVNNDGNITGDHASLPISINLAEAASCDAPTALNSSLTDDDVVLSWGAVTSATAYEITGGPISAPNAVTLNIGNVTSYPFNNLTRNATYIWKIKAFCGTDSSEFSATDQFFIPSIVCDMPTAITSTVTGNSALLSWIPSPNAIGYVINGGPITAPTSVSLNVIGGSTASFQVNNLNTGIYTWRIRAVCAVNLPVVSANTAFDQFTIISLPFKVDHTVESVPEMLYRPDVAVFPNPARDLVTLSFENVDANDVFIDMKDIQGSSIPVEIKNINDSNIIVNTSKLRSGIYSIMLRLNGSIVVKRLIITR